MSVFRNSSSLFLYLLAVTVIVAAVALSLVRLAIPYADDFRSQIQSAISNTLGRDVTIGKIDASWRHFKPRIELENIVIALDDDQELEFSVASFGVDLINSVKQRRLVAREVRFSGFELNVVQSLDGGLYLLGLPASEKSEGIEKYQKFMRWLARQKQVVVESGTLYFTSEQRPNLLHVFSNVGVYFVSEDGWRQLAMQVDIPSALGGKLELVANFDGLPLLQDDWSADSYIKLTDVSASGLAQELIKTGVVAGQVQGGDFDFEMWATIAADKSISAQGSVAAKNLRFGNEAPIGDDRGLHLSKLAADFVMQKQGNEWALAFAPLRIARVGASEQAFDLQVRYNDSDQARSLLLEAGGYRATEMLSLVQASPFLTEKQLSSLEQLRFGGDINKTVVFWQQGDEALLSAYAEFENAFIASSSKLPGIDGLSGVVSYNRDGGQLVLSGVNSMLDAPQWFRDPLQFDNLTVDLAWLKQGSEFFVEMNNIGISNVDLAMSGDVALRMPVAEKSSPYIDLALVLERADVSRRSLYLPAKIMHPNAVRWYDRALKAGTISAGTIELNGAIKKFPFKEGGGMFAVDMHVKDGELEYMSGWPAITNIAADLSIRNANIELLANQGSVFETKIQQARMSVPDFSLKPVAMTVTAAAQGASADALLFLEQSPLKARFEDTLKVLSVEGESELSLELKISIPGKVAVFGELAMVDNRLTVAKDRFVASNIDGTLGFNNKGLHGDAIAADILGMSTLVDLEPIVEGEKRGTKFSARGRGDVGTYARLSGLPWLTKFAEGESSWNAWLTVLAGESELYIESDLVGISSQSPHPLAKSSESAKLFSLSAALPFGSDTIALSLGKDVYAEVKQEPGENGTSKLALLNVGLGGAPEKRAVGDKGIYINGVLDKLVVEDWIAASALLGEGDKTASGLPVHAVLSAQQMEVFGYRWSNVNTRARQVQGSWHVSIDGEGINGLVDTQWVGADAHITLAMDELVLHSNKEILLFDDVEKISEDPRELPTLDVRVKQFRYNELNLGELAFKTSRIKQGQHIEDIAIKAPTFLLAGAGNWTQVAGKQRSSFNVAAEADDLGKALSQFGYAADNVEGGETTVNANVFWRGMPSDYSHEKLNGRLGLLVKDIQLSDIDPGAGRVFGLLSIQALPQRLSLDFSDLFKKGLQINKIKGSFSVKNGDAITDDLYMQGPAARFDIAGRIGLAKQDYDQIVAVTPAVGSSLPLVGAAIGGPAGAGIGAAVLFLHKLFNPNLFHRTYQVSGPWADPQIVLLKNVSVQTDQNNNKNTNGND